MMKRRHEEDEKRDEVEVVDPIVLPRNRSTSLSRTEADFVEEFKNSGSLEVAAAATEYANMVFKEKSKNLKGTFVKELKEAAAATTAAVETLAKRVQGPQSSGVAEELDRIRKELRDLKYENNKMKAIIARQQREIREKDEFPILRPPLAVRGKNLTVTEEESRQRHTRARTETNTSAGAPSDWDGPWDDDTMTVDELPDESPERPPGKKRRKRINKRKETEVDEGSDEGWGEHASRALRPPPPFPRLESLSDSQEKGGK